MVATGPASVVERWLVPVPLGKCSSCRRGFTVHPPGLYPRRQYQLDVVAAAVASVAIGGELAVHAGKAVMASATSVRRWTAWVAAIVRAAELHALAAQLDPSTATVPTPAPSGSRHPHAAAVLAGLEVLGAALVRAGATVVEHTGLGRVLGWQHRAHGEVLGLVAGPTRFSSAMAPGGRLPPG